MSVISNLITGNSGSSLSGGWFDTPYGDNAIAEATLTKAQKTFSSQAVTPNLPKPKTLFYVYFHLNPELEKRISYKQQFMETILNAGMNGLDTGPYMTANDANKEILGRLKTAAEDGAKLSKSGVGSLLNQAGEKIKNTVSSLNPFKKVEETLVDYIPTKDIFDKLSFEISKMVKSCDKPGVQALETLELNEYNRKRYVYTGVKYKDVKITFYDVKESPVQQFFIAYLKFICNDFFCKDAAVWEKPIDNCHWYNAKGYKTVDKKSINGTYYGNLNSFGLTIDSNFRLIDRISFCEYYMNKVTIYTIENPVITGIDWGNGAMGDFTANDLTVTFKYEGITNDLSAEDLRNDNSLLSTFVKMGQSGLKDWFNDPSKSSKPDKIELKCMVNHSIQKDVATLMQTTYMNLGGKLVSDIATTLKSYMNGDVKFSWNTLKNQAMDTARKYNMAGAANTFAKAEQTIKNFNSKDSAGQNKYLTNIATDPTSLIGTATPVSSTGNFKGDKPLT